MTAQDILQQCTVDGNIVRLPDGQLDRKLYLEVKNKLELIGGKWKGGKTYGFVFEADPAELLASIANGDNRNLKKEYQFFATPWKVRRMMIDFMPEKVEGMKVLEPSAGDGALIEAFISEYSFKEIDCFEIMRLNQIKLAKIQGANLIGEDFLLCDLKDTYDLIIANPPFTKNQDIIHISKMYECLKPGGTIISVTSTSWSFGSQKMQEDFKAWLGMVNAEQVEVEAGAFKESGTNVGAMILKIEKPTEAIPVIPDSIIAKLEQYKESRKKNNSERLSDEFVNEIKDQVIAKLINNEAADLSDAEIEKALNYCVMRDKVIRVAKQLRDDGLTIEQVRNYFNAVNENPEETDYEELEELQEEPTVHKPTWDELFGKDINEKTKEERYNNWQKFRKEALATNDIDIIEYWDNAEGCVTNEGTCIHKRPDESWCDLQGLPCAYNPITKILGMACMGTEFTIKAERTCRVCGCTDNNCKQCIKKTGQPCHWVEEDLCSACQVEDPQVILERMMENEKNIQAGLQNLKKMISPINNDDMNFFQQLHLQNAGNVDMTLRIMSKNNTLTVNIMPGSNKSIQQPIIVSGTPAEIDEAFFTTIQPGVQEIAGIVSNIEEVKKEAEEKAEAKPKEKKPETPKKKTDSKPKEKVEEPQMFE